MAAHAGGPGTRLVLVDHQSMVRTGLRLILDAAPDLVVVGEAADGAQALHAVATCCPDVVVMAVSLPVLDGIDVTRRLVEADPGRRVLLLAGENDEDLLFRALAAGTRGFLLTSAAAGDLIRAVRTVAAGEALLSPQVTRRVIDSFAAPRRSTYDPTLTPRETEVLRLLARGLSNAEIADRLVLGGATVKTHVARVLTKLEVRDRAHAVVYAYEHGLVIPSCAGAGPATGLSVRRPR